MKKFHLSKRTIVAIVTVVLSLLGCATKVVVDGITVEVAEKMDYSENADK